MDAIHTLPSDTGPEIDRWTPWNRGEQRRDGAGIRIYCLPHAGGAANAYLPWARSAEQPGLEFVPVEIPGRGTRIAVEPLTRMSDLADGLMEVLAGRPADEPFVLFGHSMGALIAYETARRLTALGRPLPLCLVVSGARPPGAPEAERFHTLDDDGLVEAIGRLGGTPREVLEHPVLMEMILPVLRADLTVLHAYNSGSGFDVLPCPVLSFGGDADRIAGPEWITGWQAVTSGGFQHRILPGEHFFVHAHRTRVAAEIAAQVRSTVADNAH